MTARHPIRRAVIIGASGGIGAAVVAALAGRPECERIYAGSRQPSQTSHPSIVPFQCDVTKPESIAAAAALVAEEGSPDLIFVGTGVLHAGALWGPEKSMRSIDAARMAEVFAVNSIGPTIIAQHFLPLLPRKQRGVFAALSARVGSISDNRLGGWHSYRASKAALNMLIRNFAIEMASRAPEAVIVGLHPGTVDSRLSAPFQRGVAPEKLFSPAQCAGYLLDVLDGLTPADSGGLFAWDGQQIPP
jgi:NAD(P)-dependent dehydrogenase (short-subunit alcohol dehydrogenase family)